MRTGLNSLNIKMSSILLSLLLVLGIFLASCTATQASNTNESAKTIAPVTLNDQHREETPITQITSVADEAGNAKREVFQSVSKGAARETILKKSGINSAQAVMITKTTVQDAKENCLNWAFEPKDCTFKELSRKYPEISKPSKYSANCISHTVTIPYSFSGKTYTFSYKGVLEKLGFYFNGRFYGNAKQKWVDIANGEIIGAEDSVRFNEYDEIIHVYETLCPIAARNAQREEDELEKRQISDEKKRVAALEAEAAEAQKQSIKTQFARLSRTDQKAIINIIGKYDIAANSPKFLFASKTAEANLDLNNFKFDHPDLKDSDLVRMLDGINSMADTNTAILFLVYLEYAKRVLMQ